MKYEDVPVGGEVILGGKLVDSDITLLALFGLKAKVVRKTPPHPDGLNEVYPFGCVEIELPEGTQWPQRIVYVGPENLASTELFME